MTDYKNSISKYVSALKKAGIHKYMLPLEYIDSALYAPAHGKGLFVGETKLLSYSFKYALTEKLHSELIRVFPYKISTLLHHAAEDLNMNNNREDNYSRLANSRLILDPDAKYSTLAIKSAKFMQKKNKMDIAERFWDNALSHIPTPEQLKKNKDHIQKLPSTFTLEEYQYQLESSNNTAYIQTDWRSKLTENPSPFIIAVNRELALLKENCFSDSKSLTSLSHEMLLSDPDSVYKRLMNQRVNENKILYRDIIIPTLAACGEHMANQGDDFAYHAEFFVRQAASYYIGHFLEDGLPNEKLLYLQQQCMEIGEKYIHLDIAAIEKETESLTLISKSKPSL